MKIAKSIRFTESFYRGYQLIYISSVGLEVANVETVDGESGVVEGFGQTEESSANLDHLRNSAFANRRRLLWRSAPQWALGLHSRGVAMHVNLG